MGWVQENLCKPEQSVKGLIIAHQQDENLHLSISKDDKIRFLRYEADFRLVGQIPAVKINAIDRDD